MTAQQFADSRPDLATNWQRAYDDAWIAANPGSRSVVDWIRTFPTFTDYLRQDYGSTFDNETTGGSSTSTGSNMAGIYSDTAAFVVGQDSGGHAIMQLIDRDGHLVQWTPGVRDPFYVTAAAGINEKRLVGHDADGNPVFRMYDTARNLTEWTENQSQTNFVVQPHYVSQATTPPPVVTTPPPANTSSTTPPVTTPPPSAPPASLARPTIQVGTTPRGYAVKQLVDAAGVTKQWIEAGNVVQDLINVANYGTMVHTAATDASGGGLTPPTTTIPVNPATQTSSLAKPTIQVGTTAAGVAILQLVDSAGVVKQWLHGPNFDADLVNAQTYGVLFHTAATDAGAVVASLEKPTIQVGTTPRGYPVKQLVDAAGVVKQWIEVGNVVQDLINVASYGVMVRTAATDAAANTGVPTGPTGGNSLARPPIQVGTTPRGLAVMQLVDDAGIVKQWIVDTSSPQGYTDLRNVSVYGTWWHTALTDAATVNTQPPPSTLERPTIQVGTTPTGYPVYQLVDAAGVVKQWISTPNGTIVDLRDVANYGTLVHSAATDANPSGPGSGTIPPATLERPQIKVGTTARGWEIFQVGDAAGITKQWIINPGPPAQVLDLVNAPTYGVLHHTSMTDAPATNTTTPPPDTDDEILTTQTEKSSTTVLLLALAAGAAYLWNQNQAKKT